MRTFRSRKHKYVNGTKGVISLLLCLVLTPFLTIALVLVESSRYQQAIETLNEVNNSASLSTLASLDSYVDQRFGLLAVTQDPDSAGDYSKYMQSNWSVMGNGAALNSASIDYSKSLSLMDKDVLKQQMVEFGELTVASELVVEGLDLDKLIEALETLGNLEELTKKVETVGVTTEVVQAVADVVTSTSDTMTTLASYDTKLAAYQKAHDEFLTAVMDLQATIKTEMDADPNLYYPSKMTPTPTPAPAATSVYDNANVTAKITILEEKTTAYKSACDALASNVDDIKAGVEKIVENMNGLSEKIEKLRSLSKDDDVAKKQISIYDQIMESFLDAFSGVTSNDAVEALENSVVKLKTQSNKLTSFDPETITHETTEPTIEGAGYAAITNIGAPDSDILNDALTQASETLGGASEGQDIVSTITGLCDSVSGLLEIDILYDGSLDANINGDYFSNLTASTGSEESPAVKVLNSITLMMNAAKSFTGAITKWDFIKALTAIVTVLKAVVEFYSAIIAWFEGIFKRMGEVILGGPDKYYESILTYGYCAYNFPSRADYKNKDGLDGNALTGYAYKDIATAEKGSGTGPLGGINALIEMLKSAGGTVSDDRTFCGAELEYILMGSQSEVMNQSLTFMNIYLFRMILDIAPIFLNTEVAELATPAGPASFVVYILEIIAEPLCDTIVLANGGDSYLIKKYVYLTPSGILTLFSDLMNCTELTDTLKTTITDSTKPKSTGPKPPSTMKDFFKDGLFPMDYKDHVLILMLCSFPEDTLLSRTQHLIQMESESYYTNKEVAGYVFALSKSYSYLNFNMDVTLNPLFSLGGLSKTGYSYKKTMYRGY